MSLVGTNSKCSHVRLVTALGAHEGNSAFQIDILRMKGVIAI